MPRPVINRLTAAASTSMTSQQRTAAPTERMLLDKRSARYRELLARLDASATLSPVEIKGIADDLRREFEKKWANVPIGIVSRCHLGIPFEVHTLSLDGSIIEHYRTGEALPRGLDRARDLARTDVYLAIEVYQDRLACVRPDGSTVVLGSGS